MIVDTAEAKCVMGVLSILEKGKARYNDMFRKTKFSHTTLQKVLKDLVDKKCIKHDLEDYEINEKGQKLLNLIKELENI